MFSVIRIENAKLNFVNEENSVFSSSLKVFILLILQFYWKVTCKEELGKT